MKRFEYSAEDIRAILAALPQIDQPSKVNDDQILFWLGAACENFLETVDNAGKYEGSSRRSQGKAVESIIEKGEFDTGSYSTMLSMHERFISAGIPPFKAMAEMVINDEIAVYDFEQFIVLKYLKRKAAYLAGKSPEECDKSQSFLKPRNELFFRIFSIWAARFSKPWHEVTISDPEETPAQNFVYAASRAAIESAGLDYPSGKTVANAIRDVKKDR